MGVLTSRCVVSGGAVLGGALSGLTAPVRALAVDRGRVAVLNRSGALVDRNQVTLCTSILHTPLRIFG